MSSWWKSTQHTAWHQCGKAKKRSLFNRESQVTSKKPTLLRQCRKSSHSCTTRNRQSDMRRAKAELMAGDRRLKKLSEFRQGNHSGRSHWRALHTKKQRTIRQQVHREQESLYWASRIESWWVEAPWWDGCGWQSEKSRGGMNGKVLQEVSRLEELWKNIKCHPASRVQKQRIFSLKVLLYCSCLSLRPCQWRPLKTRNATKIYIWHVHLRQ